MRCRSVVPAVELPGGFDRTRSIDGVAKAQSLERGTPVFPLGSSKEVGTGMHRASLRVIILVPEVGDANKSEGGAIVSVWIHTNGWSIDLEAPEMRRGGRRSFRSRRFGRVLSPGGGLRTRRLPVSRRLSLRPRTLFSSGRTPVLGGPSPQARTRRPIGVTETIPGCCRFVTFVQ